MIQEQVANQLGMNMDDPMARLFVEEVARKAEAKQKELSPGVSPAGALGLPPLLDAKRLKYDILDAAFKYEAVYDRVLVFQISVHETEMYSGTGIVMAQTSQKREEVESPRGVIVSAGAIAMDSLVSNGMDLGHTVGFIRAAPWRYPYAHVGGKALYLIALTAGDIIQSEDLKEALRSGECKISRISTVIDGVVCWQHIYVDKSGQRWNPTNPYKDSEQ